MGKFKPGDFVRIKLPPTQLMHLTKHCQCEMDLIGKVGVVDRELYDPMTFILMGTTRYIISMFGKHAISVEFCLELVPNDPDVEHEKTEDEVHV